MDWGPLLLLFKHLHWERMLEAQKIRRSWTLSTVLGMMGNSSWAQACFPSASHKIISTALSLNSIWHFDKTVCILPYASTPSLPWSGWHPLSKAFPRLQGRWEQTPVKLLVAGGPKGPCSPGLLSSMLPSHGTWPGKMHVASAGARAPGGGTEDRKTQRDQNWGNQILT